MNLLPASFVPLDKEELRDSAVSGRFILLPVLLRVRTAPDPEELEKDTELFLKKIKTCLDIYKEFRCRIHTEE